MSHAVESLLTHYESGRMSRHELVGSLTALAAAPVTAAAQSAALKAATLNHANLIVSDLGRPLRCISACSAWPSEHRRRAA